MCEENYCSLRSFWFESQSPLDPPKQDGARDNRCQAHHLRIGQPVKHSWIDANELNQKTRNAGPDEVATDYFTMRTRAVRCFRSHAPQIRCNDHSREKLVNRRGVHAIRRRYDALWKAHPPPQTCRHAVIAVSRQ